MDELRVVLRHAGVEEAHSWPLTPAGALASAEDWTPERLPGPTHIVLTNADAGAGSWTLHLSAPSAWPEDVTAEVHVGLRERESPTHVLWPRYEGIVERYPCTGDLAAEFRGAGRPALDLPDGDRLALPLAVLESAQGAWLAGADPGFSTTITVRQIDDRLWLVFAWRWLAAAGPHGDESRRLFIQPVRDVPAALDRWFALATPAVPAGPDWLHEIALQDYDYLSKDGRGWFADIDAACAMIAPRDRHRALFCLHGWYDQVGRYCFDPASGRLDDGWVAFPHVNDPRLLARASTTPVTQGLPAPSAYVFRNLDRYRPARLTWDDLRARLRYARDRGFRTAVYAMTGLQAAGPADPHVADGTGLEAAGGHLWIGPDLIGPSYLYNPLHTTVRSLFLAYIEALLDEVGPLTDALVMDEAYYIGYGRLGPPACPGYADRAQAGLIQEMAALCHRHRPDLAFLTADLLGHPSHEHDAFPYSLFADGIYQDSWCWPETWDCVRFPAWRNVAWSCNWASVSNLGWTRWGVLAHNAAVALSNGCFGDDTGLSDMDAATARRITDLWRLRGGRERAPSVAVVDACRPGEP